MPPAQQATTLSPTTVLTWCVLIATPGILSLLVAECFDLHYLATLPSVSELRAGAERPNLDHPAHPLIVAAGLLASAAVAAIGWFAVKGETAAAPIDEDAAGRTPRGALRPWRVAVDVVAGLGAALVAVGALVILGDFGNASGRGLWLFLLAAGAIAILAAEFVVLITHLRGPADGRTETR